MLFLVKDSVISEILIYNLGHNILELYNVLVKIQLTTSKMKPDIQYCKFGIRVALGVGERLMLCFMETNLIHAPYGPPPAGIHAGTDIQKLIFGNSNQKHAKVDSKLFLSYPILLDFSNFSKYYVQDCSSVTRFCI